MKYFLVMLITLIITSCASMYDIDVNKHQPYKQPDKLLDQFSLSGRFLIKNSKDTYYGNFSWWRESAVEELDLNSPIGSTVAQIKIANDAATLFANGKSYTDTNLDKLMQQQLGFSLPLEYLYYWVQGFKLPNYAVDNYLDNGFTQFGWDVEYLSWNANHLPEIIQCSKGELVIKLVNKWY